MNNPAGYLLIALLLVCSAFFSAAEMAFSSANILRLRSHYEHKKSLSLKLAIRLTENINDILSPILIGNNLANIAASSIAAAIVLELLGSNYTWISTLVMTLLVLVFGEISPKVIAKQRPETFSKICALPIFALSFILKPVSWLVLQIVDLVSKIWAKNEINSTAVSTDDFENIIDIIEDEGVLDEEQCDLLQNALDFDSIFAYEIITPRVDMESIDINDPYEKNINKILDCTFSRIPVYEDTPDHIIGILHMNHVYNQLVEKKKVSIRKLMMPVTYVHKTMPLPDVLEKMRDNKCHMVVVVDEYGGTMGILTMEDVLEQLVGEIWDENDEIDREFVCIDDTHFEASGDMRINDFFDEFDIDIDEDDDFDDDNITVGGWTVAMLDGEVSVGDSFKYENLNVTVLEVDNLRVERIAVEQLETGDEEDED